MAATTKYSPRLTDAEREALSHYDHTLDYTFSEEELTFLETHGYLLLRGIIPAETIDEFVQEALVAIKHTTGVTPADPKTWDLIPFHGCFNIWHTKTYNLLRQHPLLYSVFAQLLKTHNLTVSVDRINLKAPCTTEAKSTSQDYANRHPSLHSDCNYWHTDLDRPIYQGGLCLNDCPLGGGGFFALPGFQDPNVVREYMADVNRGKFGSASSVVPKKGKTFVTFCDQQRADTETVEVPMKKGDFVIWNNHLPHAGGKNSLMVPPNRAPNSLENFRMHAFIMFVPLDGPCATEEVASFYTTYQQETRHAISTGERPWHFATRNKTPSGGDEKKAKKSAFAQLTPLGEHILGITPYEVREE